MAGLRALACLVLTAVAVGCGGGGGDDEPPRATVTATPTVDDATLAKRAALRLDDFPSGWTATEADDAPADCELLSAAEKVASARQVSPRFNRAATTVVQNEILVYSDDATAEQAF